MKEHVVRFRVDCVEDATTERSKFRTVRYRCLLVDGPYKGQILFVFKRKGLGELVFGCEYFGKVKIFKYSSGYYNTIGG